jgi:putative ABC transport system permease protein
MEIRPILSAMMRSKTGAILVAAQVALTLAIVTNAAFVVITRIGITERATGVDEPNLFWLTLQGARTIDDPEAMVQKDLETLRAIPGVVAAGTMNQMPLGSSGWGSGITLNKDQPGSEISVAMFLGDEAAVDALGVRLVEGRAFQAAEVRSGDVRKVDVNPNTVILTRNLARRLFADGSSPIGKTVWLGSGASAPQLTVVGVVETLMTPWAQRDDNDAYGSLIAALRLYSDRASYAIRTEPGQLARVQKAAEQALLGLRTDRVMVRNKSMARMRELRYRADKTGAGMLIAVSIGLLLVTGSGIVGVASLWVSQRRKQIGVRRALGAGRIDIVRYFVTENVIITTIGAAAGAALALGLNQWLASELSIARLPIAYVIGGVLALWTLGVVAVLGPAWRAAAIPPAIATRSA